MRWQIKMANFVCQSAKKMWASKQFLFSLAGGISKIMGAIIIPETIYLGLKLCAGRRTILVEEKELNFN